MVLRYSLEEPTRKTEGAGGESPLTVGAQACVVKQLPKSYGQDLPAHSPLVRRNNTKEVGKRLLDKEMRTPNLDRMIVKRNKPMTMARSGENWDDEASDDSFLPGLTDDAALVVWAWSCRSDFPNLACLNQKFKSLIESGYLYKLRRRLGVVEHWVYLACILMPWESFDPLRRRWMRLPRIPCDECFTYADKESLAVGTKLLVFGRELSGFAIWMYRLLTRDWSRCPLMNLPRCLFGSSSLGEVAVVAGGSDNNGHILKSAELYNSEMGTWQVLAEMNVPRKLCSGFFMDKKFYVIGGMSSHTDRLTCGEEYNLETGTWRRIENMYPVSDVGGEPAMCSPPLVAVVNNQLYSADQATNEVKRYNKINNSWTVVKRLPVRADSSNGWGLAFKSCGNSLLVIGGHRGPGGEVIVLHAWEPDDENQDWHILSTRERAGAFVYNCAVMGC